MPVRIKSQRGLGRVCGGNSDKRSRTGLRGAPRRKSPSCGIIVPPALSGMASVQPWLWLWSRGPPCSWTLQRYIAKASEVFL